jgi:hypothetical protein
MPKRKAAGLEPLFLRCGKTGHKFKAQSGTQKEHCYTFVFSPYIHDEDEYNVVLHVQQTPNTCEDLLLTMCQFIMSKLSSDMAERTIHQLMQILNGIIPCMLIWHNPQKLKTRDRVWISKGTPPFQGMRPYSSFDLPPPNYNARVDFPCWNLDYRKATLYPLLFFSYRFSPTILFDYRMNKQHNHVSNLEKAVKDLLPRYLLVPLVDIVLSYGLHFMDEVLSQLNLPQKMKDLTTSCFGRMDYHISAGCSRDYFRFAEYDSITDLLQQFGGPTVENGQYTFKPYVVDLCLRISLPHPHFFCLDHCPVDMTYGDFVLWNTVCQEVFLHVTDQRNFSCRRQESYYCLTHGLSFVPLFHDVALSEIPHQEFQKDLAEMKDIRCCEARNHAKKWIDFLSPFLVFVNNDDANVIRRLRPGTWNLQIWTDPSLKLWNEREIGSQKMKIGL